MFDNKVVIELYDNDTSLKYTKPDAMFTYGSWMFGISSTTPHKIFECEATSVYPAGLPYKLCLNDITPSRIIQMTTAAVETENKQLCQLIAKTYTSGLTANSHIMQTLNKLYDSKDTPRESTVFVLSIMLGEQNPEPAVVDLLANAGLTFNTVVHQLNTYLGCSNITPIEVPTFE